MPKKKKQHTKRKGRSKKNKGNPFQWIGFSLKDKHPIFKFLLGFIGCMVVFYIFYHSTLYKNYLESPFLHAQAKLSNMILRMFGHDTQANGTVITSNDFSVNIKNGCDGLEAIAIFLSGILIFPAPLKLKLRGMLAGTGMLLLLNLVRIAGLYLIGLYFSNEVFEIFHIQGGFILFTMVSVILLFAWINWAGKKMQENQKTKLS